jgi:hypothetical protein
VPVIGPGMKKILKGAVISGGHICTGFLIILTSDHKEKLACTKAVLIGSAAACLMCLYWSLMTPVQLSNHINRLTGIEQLLSNGRTSLAVLMPLALVWFMGLIAAMYGYVFASAMFLQTIFKKASLFIIAAVVALISFAFANLGAAESNIGGEISKYTYVLLAILLFLNSSIRSGRGVVNDDA